MCISSGWWDINTGYWWGCWKVFLKEAKWTGRSTLPFASGHFLPFALLPAATCTWSLGFWVHLLTLWIGIEGCATEKWPELKLLNDIMKSSQKLDNTCHYMCSSVRRKTLIHFSCWNLVLFMSNQTQQPDKDTQWHNR